MHDDPANAQTGFQFEGFSSPNGTLVPDELFDVLAPELSEAELRVCLYIIRRTFGFKKQSDEISLRQMVEGIRTRDGRVLDHGAGVVKSAAARAVKGLVAKGVVIALRNASADRGYEPTTYALRFKQAGDRQEPGEPRGDPMSSTRTRDVLERDRPMSSRRTNKKQSLQETASSKGEGASTLRESRAETPYLDEVIGELSAVLGDGEHLAANRAQARNLLGSSRLSEQQLVARMYEALAVTRDRARSTRLGAKAAYFFAVLRDLITLQPTPSAQAGSSPAIAPPLGGEGDHTNVPEPEPPLRTAERKHRERGHSIPESALKTTEAWTKVLRLLSGEISEAALRGYFAHTELRDVRDGHAVVVASNAFVAEQLDQRFRTGVAAALTSVIGTNTSVSFESASTAQATRPDASRRRGPQLSGHAEQRTSIRTPELQPAGGRHSPSQA